MVNPSNENQDPSKATMDASTAMTIEFLRARLLSERSVSRTARQRADELAKRVTELEEKLKIVTLQRKQAEKATADVLAILENHGISDTSEALDSGSDQEATFSESKLINNSRRVGETSANMKLRINDIEAFPGNEVESSSVTGRSLSWKSGKNSSHSLEKRKYMDSTRRKHSIASPDSSSTERVGKSCRQIRHVETRSSVEDLQNDDSMFVLNGDGVANCLEGSLDCYDVGTGTSGQGSENNEERDLLEDPASGILVNEKELDDHYFNGHGREKDMERALEHQAQLIGRYEAEEKAQREWEERFRDYNSCTPDSCDPGNHSDVTEERDEIKAPAPPCSAKAMASQNLVLKAEAGDACSSKDSKTPTDLQLNHLPQNGDKRCLQDENSSNMGIQDSHASEFAFSVPKWKHGQECSESLQYPHLHGSHHHTSPHYAIGKHGAAISSSCVDSGSSKLEASESKNELALITYRTPDKIGSVLEALQQAKISLKLKLDTLPLVEGGSVGNAIGTSIPRMPTDDKLEIPVGSGGLFRLPTDLQFKTSNQSSILGSDSQLSLTNYSGENVGDKIFSIPYVESSRSRVSMDNRFLTVPADPFMETRAGIPIRSRVLEPDSVVGLPSSSGYSYVNSSLSTELPSGKSIYSTYPLFQDPMMQMSSTGGLSRHLPSGEVGLPPATPFSFYDSHINSNMYM